MNKSETFLLFHPIMREYHNRRIRMYEYFSVPLDLFLPSDLYDYDGDVFSYNFDADTGKQIDGVGYNYNRCLTNSFKTDFSSFTFSGNEEIIVFRDSIGVRPIDEMDFTNENYIISFSRDCIFIDNFSIDLINAVYNNDHSNYHFSSTIMSKLPLPRKKL